VAEPIVFEDETSEYLLTHFREEHEAALNYFAVSIHR
jgi:hypothetical protein